MKKIKLSGVSLCTLLAATGANAAGYTCNELIEYTSCMDGYYLMGGDCIANSTCSAGNYLVNGCSSEYANYAEHWCRYMTDVGTEWESEVVSSVGSKEECEEFPESVYLGAGCYEDDFGPFQVECVPCSVGTYQPVAGQNSCLQCPAGSYCATAGLSTPSGECNIGTYSLGGATAATCTSCPTTGLTDKDGKPVVATTTTTGSTSPIACHIGNNVEFKDAKGIYRYNQICTYGSGSERVACEEAAGAYWEIMDEESQYCTCDELEHQWYFEPEKGFIGCFDSQYVECIMDGREWVEDEYGSGWCRR